MNSQAFAAARAAIAALEINPLWGHEKQTAEARKDAGKILDELEAALAADTLPASTYCRHCGRAAMAGGQTPICQDCWEELG